MGNLCSQLKVHDSEVHQSGQVGSEPAGVVTLEPTQCSGYSDSSPTRHSNMSLLEEDDTPSQATMSAEEALPSDEDLAEEVVSVLSHVNVQEYNIKMLMQHLNGKYRVNLREKKPLIKTVAIQYCTEHAPRNNEEEN